MCELLPITRPTRQMEEEMASEAEAKTKWCPFARVATLQTETTYGTTQPASPVANRWVAGPHTSGQKPSERISLCIGSACMAWRWSDAKRTAAFLEAVQAHMKSVPNPNFAKSTQVVYAERGREFEQTEGYCGLAGAAQ